MAAPASPLSRNRERVLAASRASVLRMLGARFPTIPDHEDLYQEACSEAVAWVGDRQISAHDLAGLVRNIAFRRAMDMRRRQETRPTTVEYQGEWDHPRANLELTLDEKVEDQIAADLIRLVADELDSRGRAIIKLRFDFGMSSTEIAEYLGVKPKRLEKLTTATYSKIAKRLRPDDSGLSPWQRDQRELFVRCLADQATPDERARAQNAIEADPTCRAMFSEMRAALTKVAALLPIPLLPEPSGQRVLPVLDQLNQSGAALRDALTNSASRAAAHTPAAEPVAGGIATLSAAGAAKVVLVCLTLGGGATVCLQVGVLGRDPKPENAIARDYERRPPAKEERAAKVRPRPPAPKPVVHKAPTAQPVVQRPTTNGPPAPSPVPPGSEEFGPGSIGSVGASKVPAAAPADGGGEFTP